MDAHDLPIRTSLAAGLVLCILTACGGGPEGSAPAPASATSSPPASPPIPGPTSGPYTVEGEVFSFETGAITAPVDLWVQLGTGGYSYWWAHGRLDSDLTGHFEASNLPASQITVFVAREGYEQPCAATHEVRSDLSIRVELVPSWSLDAFNPPRPQLSTEPSVTGVIFEKTASGREPVSGASLWAEHLFEVSMAKTRSDRGGGFYLCRLGSPAWIHVSKAGFEAKWVGPIDGSTAQVLEIELQRSTP